MARLTLALAAATTTYAGSSSARACTPRTLCVDFMPNLSDGETGDYVGVGGGTVPARGAHVIIVRAYPEPVLDGYLSVQDTEELDAGCIEFDSQFAAGHKAIIEAQQAMLKRNPDAKMAAIPADTAVNQGRWLLQQMLEQENPEAMPTA